MPLSTDLISQFVKVTKSEPEESKESTAYGTRLILENFERSGVTVCNVAACGGISRKNSLMLQIYADVLGRPITIAREEQTTALGAAILAASAACCL